MGLNTAALILNDGLHEINRDTEIGQKIYHSCASAHRDGGYVSSGGHHGVMQVLPPVHADYVQIIAIGRNTIRPLGTSGKWEPEDLLRDLALQIGYSLRKLPSKAAA